MKRMRRQAFRDLPVNRKVMAVVMAVTTASLLLSGIGIVGADHLLFRQSLERDVSALGEIVADNSTAALAFNDPRIAAETLASLRARPHLVAACLFGADGALFARYLRPGSGIACPETELTEAANFGEAGLKVWRAVKLQEKKLGNLLLFYDLDEISNRTKLYGSIVLGVFVIAGLMAFALSASLRSLITAPILRLVAVTTSVSETSDYAIRAERESNDELGVLVERFNEMLAGIQSRDLTLTEALREREEALSEAETARERFRFMAESMPQKIFTTTSHGDVDYLNKQWQEFTGLSFDQIKRDGWMTIIHPDDYDAVAGVWQHSIESGEPFHWELRFCRADGEYCWHLGRAHAMRNPEGKISMWIGSYTDIHEQKEREAQLRRANADLEQFVYSASHDLQEPVRNVAVYSEVIARRYQAQLDDSGRQFLGFLNEGGHRLAMLIRDLLAYTHAGNVDDRRTTVDSAKVLQHTLSSVAEAIRESGATVTYDPLPEVVMGEAHLQQLFQNLITNAIKYRSTDAPLINISAERVAGEWRFRVQDNGIGIDPRYKEKIFGVFKRLHHDDTRGGTGIGLAICRRVVEQYGGRIWVESEEGRGASFFFTVPLAKARPAIESAIG
ncbi:MAG: PAS domain S-box protein [Bryobacteraceae bacterium]|nr:PAS domain S-box protein [Bryobacteraceae bacterium]